MKKKLMLSLDIWEYVSTYVPLTPHLNPRILDHSVSAALRIFTATVSSLMPKSQLLTLTHNYSLIDGQEDRPIKGRGRRIPTNQVSMTRKW